MPDLLTTAAVAVAIICNGLLAGVFFAFARAVVPGLRRVDDHVYVTAFRGVNAAILNGWFLSVFLVAPILAGVVVAVLDGPGRWWAIAALVCAIATFVITAAVNVPLNRRLDAASAHTAAESANARRGFERRWNTAHLIRTVTSIGALAFTTVAAVA
ncbi:anthrone oxygenase family protein [Microbacterium sp.]|uniref:anthrone oxygenase family protein n=1 Tax=Microbacterium sp. TaxID=51671 RepID=UPI003F9B9213